MVYSLFDGDILSYSMEDVKGSFRLSHVCYSVGKVRKRSQDVSGG